MANAVPIRSVRARAYTIPTPEPESDGTLEWDSTTIVIVEASAGDRTGLGYSYTSAAAATVVHEQLAKAVEGCDAMAVGAAWARMVHAIRNLGRPGIASTAISAVDLALWDLKARLVGVPLASLLERFHDAVPIYGSGGFTSLSDDELAQQVGAWASSGIPRVKMKVGREPDRDPERVRVAREAIGEGTELFVDANGALSRTEALGFAERVAGDLGVRWFEEPVSSDDLEGLRFVRDRAPAGMDVAAGEYGYDLPYFERMLAAGAVDCLQADVTRCGGITGFRQVAALCDARSLELSAHCAPAASIPACLSIWHLRHLEYFADHVRIESMLFDGVPEPDGGVLRADLTRPGLGLELKRADAERYAV